MLQWVEFSHQRTAGDVSSTCAVCVLSPTGTIYLQWIGIWYLNIFDRWYHCVNVYVVNIIRRFPIIRIIPTITVYAFQAPNPSGNQGSTTRNFAQRPALYRQGGWGVRPLGPWQFLLPFPSQAEVMMTCGDLGVYPVISLDGRTIGDGKAEGIEGSQQWSNPLPLQLRQYKGISHEHYEDFPGPMFAVSLFVLLLLLLALLSYPIIIISYHFWCFLYPTSNCHGFHTSSSEVGPVAKKLKELIWKAGPLRIFICQVKMDGRSCSPCPLMYWMDLIIWYVIIDMFLSFHHNSFHWDPVGVKPFILVTHFVCCSQAAASRKLLREKMSISSWPTEMGTALARGQPHSYTSPPPSQCLGGGTDKNIASVWPEKHRFGP